jgi:hypothetical protein
MCYRYLMLLSAVVAAIALVIQAPVAAAGHARTAAVKTKATAADTAKPWTPSRMPDGHPDLQGIWSFATITPLQRPDDLAGKQVLTDEETARLEQRAAANRIDRPPRPGDPGAYNQFWIDSGTKVVPTKQSSLIVDPPDGRLPPLTPEGQKRAAALAETLHRPATGPEDLTPYERCILGFNSGPPMIPGPYNNNFQLLQTSGYVVILNEMVHNARIVPLAGRPYSGPALPQWAGDSRGRWEGDMLIVETTNFTDNGTGTISLRNIVDVDKNLHLVERFRRTDADTLLYEFVVDDPTVWTRPWTAAVPMTKTADKIYEYACHEGNYAMFGILRGARTQEKADADAKITK